MTEYERRCDKSIQTITSVVHALLCRSIFIKYLEERKDSNGEAVFPCGFYSTFLDSAKHSYENFVKSEPKLHPKYHFCKEKALA